MTRLSVNVNKIATLRNARGGGMPDVVEAAVRIQEFGAHGITVHPRPDARHITYGDVRALRPVVFTEFNVEGYPSRDFLDLVLEVRPDQVTLVPDPPDALTSNAGWDTVRHAAFLQEVVMELRSSGMRVSLFLETAPRMADAAAAVGADRIELYTEPYAQGFPDPRAVVPFAEAAAHAYAQGLGVNAGHDLNSANLPAFVHAVPHLAEVSIGHALISEALYDGLETTVARYLACLQPRG
jgi:pyridoxine 5-phosphate synthase